MRNPNTIRIEKQIWKNRLLVRAPKHRGVEVPLSFFCLLPVVDVEAKDYRTYYDALAASDKDVVLP